MKFSEAIIVICWEAKQSIYDDSWTCVKFKYHSKQGTRLPRTGHIQAEFVICEEIDINSRNIHPIDPSSQHKFLLWKHLLFHRHAGVSHHHNYVHMKQPLHPPIEHPYNQKNHPCNEKTSCLIALNCENKQKTKLGSVHWPQICITMFELDALLPKSILKYSCRHQFRSNHELQPKRSVTEQHNPPNTNLNWDLNQGQRSSSQA
jgi:hypothetical protein